MKDRVSNLESAFAGMSRAAESPHAQAPKRSGAQVPKPLSTGAPKRPSTQALPLQGTGKSSHPDFEAFKVYLRTATKRAAARKFEDETGGDFSDLCEKLLAEYLGA
jgi:hypothetical protein